MNKPSIRRSQIITTFGPGALVNLVHGSYIGMGIDYWPRDPKFEDRVYDDRLQKRLGKKFFVQPPSNEVNEVGLPYRRFPRWFFCPKCRKLQPFEEWEKRNPRSNLYKPLFCPDDRAPLSPMNFLVACIKGHIDDFPWAEWVHRFGITCPNRTEFQYSKSFSGAGLGGIKIKCSKCNAFRTMQGSFSKDAFKELKCNGAKPWIGKTSYSSCGEKLVTVQRGGSNVYFPKIISSIAIPSPFNNIIDEIKRTDGWLALSSMVSMNLLSDDTKQKIVEQIAKETRYPTDEIYQLVERYGIESDEKQENSSEENYLYDEYAAFHSRNREAGCVNRDFCIEDVSQEFNYKEFGIESVLMVKTIREVRALMGFTRLKPMDIDDELDSNSTVEKPRLVELSEKKLNWLPAIEVRGEGIFFTFDENELGQWSSLEEVKSRISLINFHLKKSCEKRILPYKPVSAKKVFLHTFSHLLIKQLSFECGYSSTSLRERIYCDNGGDHKMQGILIYTAAGDADGTLGGLVRQAKGDRFPDTLRAALINSSWCSNDPLCVEGKGQGLDSLNLAACYACCLLPETSCEIFNKFLDRALVVGLIDDPSVGFLGNIAKGMYV